MCRPTTDMGGYRPHEHSMQRSWPAAGCTHLKARVDEAQLQLLILQHPLHARQLVPAYQPNALAATLLLPKGLLQHAVQHPLEKVLALPRPPGAVGFAPIVLAVSPAAWRGAGSEVCCPYASHKLSSMRVGECDTECSMRVQD